MLSGYENSLEKYLEDPGEYWKRAGIYGEQHSGNHDQCIIVSFCARFILLLQWISRSLWVICVKPNSIQMTVLFTKLSYFSPKNRPFLFSTRWGINRFNKISCCRILFCIYLILYFCTYFIVYFSLHFNGHFPGEPVLAGVYWSKGWWRWWWQLEL